MKSFIATFNFYERLKKNEYCLLCFIRILSTAYLVRRLFCQTELLLIKKVTSQCVIQHTFVACTCTDFISGCRVPPSWANGTTISNLAIQEIIASGMGDFPKDETDYRECRNVEKDKAPSYCKNLLLNKNEYHEYQDSNIYS